MKQEHPQEIREKQDRILNLVKAWAVIPHPYKSPDAEGLLYSLSLEGVVIKVDCPVCRGYARPNKVTFNLHTGYAVNGHSCPNCDNKSYVAVEPLIKEEKC